MILNSAWTSCLIPRVGRIAVNMDKQCYGGQVIDRYLCHTLFLGLEPSANHVRNWRYTLYVQRTAPVYGAGRRPRLCRRVLRVFGALASRRPPKPEERVDTQIFLLFGIWATGFHPEPTNVDAFFGSLGPVPAVGPKNPKNASTLRLFCHVAFGLPASTPNPPMSTRSSGFWGPCQP